MPLTRDVVDVFQGVDLNLTVDVVAVLVDIEHHLGLDLQEQLLEVLHSWQVLGLAGRIRGNCSRSCPIQPL